MDLPGRAPTAATTQLLAALFGDAPFSRAQAEASGISRGRLRAAVARGLITRLQRDTYVATTLDADGPYSPASLRHALAGLRGLRFAVSGRAAAYLHGLPYVAPAGHHDGRHGIEILLHADDVSRCGRLGHGEIIRSPKSWPEDIVVIDGQPVTSLLYSAIDVVRMGLRPHGRIRPRALPLPEALVVLDAATRRAGASDRGAAAMLLQSYRKCFWHCTGIRAVDEALPFIDPLAESPLESWSRGYMSVYGVPPPLTQQVVTGSDGVDYRVDFCWPGLRLIGEADGIAKYGDTPAQVHEAKRRELARQRALEEAGWLVVRWTWDELARDPWIVMRRILTAMRQAA